MSTPTKNEILLLRLLAANVKRFQSAVLSPCSQLQQADNGELNNPQPGDFVLVVDALARPDELSKAVGRLFSIEHRKGGQPVYSIEPILSEVGYELVRWTNCRLVKIVKSPYRDGDWKAWDEEACEDVG